MNEDLPFFIKSRLKTRIVGSEVVYYRETDSTNDDAVQFASRGVEEGWVIIAGNQRSGKGRRGKTWNAPGGQNVYLSLILRPRISTKRASLLTILAALAVAEVLGEYILKDSGQVSIKWPNDVMIGDKKISGILLEMGKDKNNALFYVIGIGININARIQDMPEAIRNIATSLYMELGYAVSVKDVLFKLLYRLDYWYRLYCGQRFDEIIARFRTYENTTGKRVSVMVAGNIIEGEAIGVDDNGFLHVRDDYGKVHISTSGELTIEDE
ncbi:MAG: biotin--[acetyl-CoA-carboxylase] ligase [Deltaproteobacteria bacterium]|nr:biotin--[acetyl-CoA-carboxylase] ligase [Candidatus Zymogenaceae bacterium]